MLSAWQFSAPVLHAICRLLQQQLDTTQDIHLPAQPYPCMHNNTHACTTIHIPYARLYQCYNINMNTFSAAQSVDLHGKQACLRLRVSMQECPETLALMHTSWIVHLRNLRCMWSIWPDIGRKASREGPIKTMRKKKSDCLLRVTTGACVPGNSSPGLPVKFLIEDLQLLLGFGQWQSPLNGFCQLQAVPPADAGLGLVIITAPII